MGAAHPISSREGRQRGVSGGMSKVGGRTPDPAREEQCVWGMKRAPLQERLSEIEYSLP